MFWHLCVCVCICVCVCLFVCFFFYLFVFFCPSLCFCLCLLLSVFLFVFYRKLYHRLFSFPSNLFQFTFIYFSLVSKFFFSTHQLCRECPQISCHFRGDCRVRGDVCGRRRKSHPRGKTEHGGSGRKRASIKNWRHRRPIQGGYENQPFSFCAR